MYSKYFAYRYFPGTYFANGASYLSAGDIKTILLKQYVNYGDIQTICGLELSKNYDVWATVLKRKNQQKIEFDYDITTDLT